MQHMTDKHFVEFIKAQINEAAMKAAEPFIQDALQEVEKQIREKVAAQLIALIKADYDVMRHQVVIQMRSGDAARNK